MADGTAQSVAPRSEPNDDRRHRRAIIALEVRPRCFGFAVFEKPTLLLDWGVREAPRGQKPASAMAGRAGPIFDRHGPILLVLRQRTDHKAHASHELAFVLREIIASARVRAIQVHWIHTSSVRALF